MTEIEKCDVSLRGALAEVEFDCSTASPGLFSLRTMIALSVGRMRESQ
jgi:hypothetical protein